MVVGLPPIDLVDGQQLVEKMKELGLGLKSEMKEVAEVDKVFFRGF